MLLWWGGGRHRCHTHTVRPPPWLEWEFWARGCGRSSLKDNEWTEAGAGGVRDGLKEVEGRPKEWGAVSPTACGQHHGGAPQRLLLSWRSLAEEVSNAGQSCQVGCPWKSFSQLLLRKVGRKCSPSFSFHAKRKIKGPTIQGSVEGEVFWMLSLEACRVSLCGSALYPAEGGLQGPTHLPLPPCHPARCTRPESFPHSLGSCGTVCL